MGLCCGHVKGTTGGLFTLELRVSVKGGGWFASSSILAKRMRIFSSGPENNIFPSHMDTHFSQLICFH